MFQTSSDLIAKYTRILKYGINCSYFRIRRQYKLNFKDQKKKTFKIAFKYLHRTIQYSAAFGIVVAPEI